MNMSKYKRKLEMLEKILLLYVNQGLDNTSMRDVAKLLDINISTLYDYFASKEDLVMETARFYMLGLKNKLLEKHISIDPDMKKEVKFLFDILVEEKENLRFIYQVISSPTYGERGRKELKEIYTEYFSFSDLLADAYKIDRKIFEAAFMLFVSVIHDYCLWDNEEYARKKMRFIEYLIDSKVISSQRDF